MFNKIENPCEGCELPKRICEEYVMPNCNRMLVYQSSLEVQAKTAWEIVDWMKDRGIHYHQRGSSIYDVIELLKLELKEAGIERP